MRLQWIIILGLLGGYVAGAAAERYAWRGAEALDREARGGVIRRFRERLWLLHALDVVGVALLLFGLVRLMGVLRGTVPLIWAPRALAVGVTILCFERVLRGWTIWRAFAAEEASRPAARRAGVVAIVLTLLQVAIAAAICGWVFTQVRVIPISSAPAPLAATGDDEKTADAEGVLRQQWVSEDEALRILGKDRHYLDLLARYDQVPMKAAAGGTFYDRQFLETRKASGLPALEELETWAKKEEAQMQQRFFPLLQVVLPPLDGGRKIDAIKQARELTGWGLKDGKDFVDKTEEIVKLVRAGRKDEALQLLTAREKLDPAQAGLAVEYILSHPASPAEK